MSIGNRKIVRDNRRAIATKKVWQKEKKVTKSMTTKTNMQSLERILIHGDLSPMDETQRLQYVKAVCKAIGVSILFRPFDYIKMQGKTVLYANRACAEQLRMLHGISITVTRSEHTAGLCIVTAKATDKKGRTDEAIGAVNIKGLVGEALANAIMKAETKAKRRVTLSIAGLGMLDEVEAKQVAEREEKIATDIAIEETQAVLAETTERPEFENEQVAPSVVPPTPLEYTLKTMRGAKGKPISQVPVKKLKEWLGYYDKMMGDGNPLSPEVQDESIHVREFLTTFFPEEKTETLGESI